MYFVCFQYVSRCWGSLQRFLTPEVHLYHWPIIHRFIHGAIKTCLTPWFIEYPIMLYLDSGTFHRAPLSVLFKKKSNADFTSSAC